MCNGGFDDPQFKICSLHGKPIVNRSSTILGNAVAPANTKAREKIMFKISLGEVSRMSSDWCIVFRVGRWVGGFAGKCGR